MTELQNRPILVALGSDARALRLIHAAFWAAREGGRPWVAVHVEPLEGEDPTRAGQARLWLQEAERLGAEPLWEGARTTSAGLVECCRRLEAIELLVGQPGERWPWGRLGHGLAAELQRRLPGLRVAALPLGNVLPAAPWLPPQGQRLGALLGSAMALAACLGTGLLLPPEQPVPARFLLCLLATALAAHCWGRLAGLLASAAAILAFGPLFGAEAPLLALLGTVLLGGQGAVALAARLDRQTRVAQRREALLAALLLLGSRLTEAGSPEEAARALSSVGERLLGRPLVLLLPAEGGLRMLPETSPEGPVPEPASASRPQQGLELRRAGGYGFLPLPVRHAQGALLRAPLDGFPPLTEEDGELLQSCAAQAALALERLDALAAAQQAAVARESERLRSALLDAVGHDLRTPLAAIHGAASSLLLSPQALPAGAEDLVSLVRDESARLARLLGNLLDLTRLEQGGLAPQRDWHALEELAASALERSEATGGPLDLRMELPEALPLVPVDGVLVEQLFLNLLENARRHAPGSPVDLRAWASPGGVELEVADRGPGIPEAERERVFQRFYRRPGSPDGGAGLGLAICEAIARVHGGRIWVEDRPGGGARFRVHLPVEGAPPAVPVEAQP
jgi:two-component system sensor histidine kinase KdpD